MQGLVVQVLVPHEDLQRVADVRLLADDQAERPEVGEAAELGEPDTEVFAPGRGGGALEQVRDRHGRRPPVLGVEARGIQAGVAHHRGRVEAEGSGELDEVVQARVAGQLMVRIGLTGALKACEGAAAGVSNSACQTSYHVRVVHHARITADHPAAACLRR